ncbi:MAG: hypothetical protein ACFE95_15595 [Candidatus Hodarchaeota archaeon]
MSSDFEGWSNLPKAVKLLDISIIGFLSILFVAVVLYFGVLDQTVQNLMIIFLVAILSLFTWYFRAQLVKASDFITQKRYFREWFIVCSFIIIIIGILVLAYPVTY